MAVKKKILIHLSWIYDESLNDTYGLYRPSDLPVPGTSAIVRADDSLRNDAGNGQSTLRQLECYMNGVLRHSHLTPFHRPVAQAYLATVQPGEGRQRAHLLAVFASPTLSARAFLGS